MAAILPTLLLFVVFIFLFIRQVKLDRKKFLENDRLADEHILREVERFIKLMESKSL